MAQSKCEPVGAPDSAGARSIVFVFSPRSRRSGNQQYVLVEGVAQERRWWPVRSSGTVTDTSAAPIAGVEVDVDDPADNLVTSTQTDVGGNYTVSGLLPGNYEVGFVPTSGPGYASQFFDGKATLTAADPVSVSSGSTRSGVDAALAAGGQIAGTVTDASSGAGVGNVQVVVYGTTGTVIASATTARDGTYTVLGLAPGSYHVGFFPGGPFAVQFYTGRALQSAADAIAVTAGLTTSGIDAALQPPTSTLSVALTGTGSGSVTATVRSAWNLLAELRDRHLSDADGQCVRRFFLRRLVGVGAAPRRCAPWRSAPAWR